MAALSGGGQSAFSIVDRTQELGVHPDCQNTEFASNTVRPVLCTFKFHPLLQFCYPQCETWCPFLSVPEGREPRRRAWIHSSCSLHDCHFFLGDQGENEVCHWRVGWPQRPPFWWLVCSAGSGVLQWTHGSRLTCHPVFQRTQAFLLQHFWWATLEVDMHGFIKACTICSQHKPSHHAPSGLLQPLALPLCQIFFCVCVLMPDSPALFFGLFSWLWSGLFSTCLSFSCPGKLLILPSDFACSLAVLVCLSSSYPATCSFLRIIDLWDYFLEFLDTVLTLCSYMDRLLLNHWESSSVVCVLQLGPPSAYDT